MILGFHASHSIEKTYKITEILRNVLATRRTRNPCFVHSPPPQIWPDWPPGRPGQCWPCVDLVRTLCRSRKKLVTLFLERSASNRIDLMSSISHDHPRAPSSRAFSVPHTHSTALYFLRWSGKRGKPRIIENAKISIHFSWFLRWSGRRGKPRSIVKHGFPYIFHYFFGELGSVGSPECMDFHAIFVIICLVEWEAWEA